MLKKITQLRQLMKRSNIDFYLIFSGDEFGCEYTPNYANKLLWLTGFTGSNGIALVSTHKLYFFTDGRYLLQAAKELPDFEICDLTTTSIYEIINRKPQQKVALTFKLINALQYQKLKTMLISHQIIDVDLLEQHETVKPITKLFIYHHGGVAYQEKLANFAKSLPAKLAYYAITAPDAVCWLLNLRAKDDVAYSPMALIRAVWEVATQQFYLFTDAAFADELQNYLYNIKILPLAEFYNFLAQLPQVAFDYKSANAAMLAANTLNITDPIALAKACKNHTEIKGSILAHQKDGHAFINFLYWLAHSKEEKSEISLGEKLLSYKKQDPDFIDESFASIVGFKEHGAIIHYHANEDSSKKIIGQGLLLIDAGSQYLQGTTDITRTIAIGEPSALEKLHFTLVLKGHIALLVAKFPPQTTGAQLDALARYHLWQHGLDYAHGTGHGVGSFLNVHEGPCGISKNSHTPLQEGMILSNEPGFYLQGSYGIRIESLMLVVATENNYLTFKNLSLVPIDLKLIDFALLNESEIQWLKNYHQSIGDIIGEKLAPHVKAWLETYDVN
jgi:Xaa-Pro aminopeptidase